MLVEMRADPESLRELDRVLSLADEVIRFKVTVRRQPNRPQRSGAPGRAARAGGDAGVRFACDGQAFPPALPGFGGQVFDRQVVRGMASENQVTIVGNVTGDPELRYTPNGAALVKFGVAVSRRFKDEPRASGRTPTRRSSTSRAWRSHGREHGRVDHAGNPRGRHRAAAHQLVGDARGREALEDRDRGRGGRAEPEVGHRQGREAGPVLGLERFGGRRSRRRRTRRRRWMP